MKFNCWFPMGADARRRRHILRVFVYTPYIVTMFIYIWWNWNNRGNNVRNNRGNITVRNIEKLSKKSRWISHYTDLIFHPPTTRPAAGRTPGTAKSARTGGRGIGGRFPPAPGTSKFLCDLVKCRICSLYFPHVILGIQFTWRHMGYITSHVKYSTVDHNYCPLKIDNFSGKFLKSKNPGTTSATGRRPTRWCSWTFFPIFQCELVEFRVFFSVLSTSSIVY